MKNNQPLVTLRYISIFTTLLFNNFLSAQQQTNTLETKNQFWENVQFGGGIGLGIGTGYTDISLGPSAIYNFNDYVALALGYNMLMQSRKTILLPIYTAEVLLDYLLPLSKFNFRQNWNS